MQKQVPVLPRFLSTWTLLVWEIAIASWIFAVVFGSKVANVPVPGENIGDFSSAVALCSFYFALGWAISMEFGAKWKNALSVPVYWWLASAPVFLSVTLFIVISRQLGLDPSFLVIPIGGAIFALNTVVIIYRLGILDIPKRGDAVKCPNCGRKHNGAKFCPRCGASQEPKKP